MSKKILVLEPSATTQALVISKLKKSGHEVVFETNGIKLLVTMYNTMPDAVLLNAKCVSPKSSELVRLIKSVEKLRTIPVGVYATSDFSFEHHYMMNTGADQFIHFEQDNLIEKLDKMFELAQNKKLKGPMASDILKSGISENIFSYLRHLDDIQTLSQDFLNLLTEFCEVPAVSMFINEENITECFFVCASNFTETETSEFLKVCTSDFEEIFPDTNIFKISPKKLETSEPIEKYHSGDIPLSAFQCIRLETSECKTVGTVNLVREGAFTTHQLDLMNFAVNLFSLVLENALILHKKIIFEKNIRRAFSRFVPEQIIDNLVQEGAEQGNKNTVGEKRDVAILFSDIRSFTSISELNKPESIVGFLNRYFTTMCTIIKKHGGTVDKFIGDAIMALFGAPVSYEDNCKRAVAAAYEMREALNTIALEDLLLPPDMIFNIGIGIHYGDVIVGSIGSSDKTDYSVIGDNVNLASRMEGLTKTYGSMILVTDAVRKDVLRSSSGVSAAENTKSDFEFRYLDDVKVKGKEKAVSIYAIDRSREEFSENYRNYYNKGLELYKNATWNLAKEYFEKALSECPEDKAAKLMCARCIEFEQNPPENWDGAITFNTK